MRYSLGGYASDPNVQTGRAAPFSSICKHLGLLALLTELVGGVDREQHRFALALIGAVLLAVELDEPYVLLADDEVTGTRALGGKVSNRCGIAGMHWGHDKPL